MATEILLEGLVFQTTKCVAGFVTASNNDDEDYEQFDFIIEATTDVTTDEETYIVKWSDKKPKRRKSIENDIVMNYKLSNY
jgi:hypothetical protein